MKVATKVLSIPDAKSFELEIGREFSEKVRFDQLTIEETNRFNPGVEVRVRIGADETEKLCFDTYPFLDSVRVTSLGYKQTELSIFSPDSLIEILGDVPTWMFLSIVFDFFYEGSYVGFAKIGRLSGVYAVGAFADEVIGNSKADMNVGNVKFSECCDTLEDKGDGRFQDDITGPVWRGEDDLEGFAKAIRRLGVFSDFEVRPRNVTVGGEFFTFFSSNGGEIDPNDIFLNPSERKAYAKIIGSRIIGFLGRTGEHKKLEVEVRCESSIHLISSVVDGDFDYFGSLLSKKKCRAPFGQFTSDSGTFKINRILGGKGVTYEFDVKSKGFALQLRECKRFSGYFV